MKIKTVWGVYFSATGTTEKIVTGVAAALARRLGAEYKPFSFSLPDARKQSLSFSKGDHVVLGLPVYAGRVPNLLLPYIKDSIAGGGAWATPVVLFGNRSYDDALIELRDIMQSSGFHTLSAGAFVGEHSFSDTLAQGRPDAEDMALAAVLAEKTADIIRALAEPPKEAVSVNGSTPLRPYYIPRGRHGEPISILAVKPKTDSSRCTACGLCARLCTMGSVDPSNVSDIPGKCIKCCACVKKCPAQAKYFDDPGYLYHRQELEQLYARRASVELFW